MQLHSPSFLVPVFGAEATHSLSWAVVGLRNQALAFNVPEMSSVTCMVTVTVAGPAETSMDFGLKSKSTNTGGVVSGTADVPISPRLMNRARTASASSGITAR